jgi:hypothetical protein
LISGRVFYPVGKGKVVIGENSERALRGNTLIKTHAEIDALQKLENYIRRKKIKSQKMNLIVLRVNKSGNLCESAPCYHCTQELIGSSIIQIDKLYYSRSDQTITCVKFKDWINSGYCHVSKGWRWLERIRKK